MNVEIVSISDELLMGDTLDTNTGYVSRCLREINAEVTHKLFVGDDLNRITDAFRVALRRSDVVLAIGGLGDGPQKFTRLAAAQATGRSLTPQAPGIEDARILGGPGARSAGFLMEVEQGILICLPGWRRDMAYLLETEVLPYLQERVSVDTQLGRALLRTVGMMESSLKQQLKDIVQDARHRITYDTFAGQTNIQLWVQAESARRIEHELAEMKQLVLARLGDHVYGEGDDKLEDVVLSALVRGGWKLILAECYTDKTLAHMLNHIPVPDGILQLSPVSTWNELHEMVQMDELTPGIDLTRWCRVAVERLMVQAESDLGLLIYKNVTQGGVQLLVTLASRMGVSVTQRSFGGHPENINQWAATLGLSHLRRWTLAHQ